MATKKRYANVLDMMGDLAEDQAFTDDLGRHLNSRRLVTELAALRAARGLSQKEVGEKMRCTQGSVSKLESGEDAALNLGAFVAYADAIGLNIEITLVGKDVTLVDRVKHHAFCIKRLTDHLAMLGAKDARIADGVAGFLKEAAYNLVKLVKSSANLLPCPPQTAAQPISVDVYGVDEKEEASCPEACGA